MSKKPEKKKNWRAVSEEDRKALIKTNEKLTLAALQEWQHFRDVEIKKWENGVSKGGEIRNYGTDKLSADVTHTLGAEVDEKYSINMSKFEDYGVMASMTEEMASRLETAYEIILNNWVTCLEDEKPATTVETFAHRRSISVYSALLRCRPMVKKFERLRGEMHERIQILKRKQDQVTAVLRNYSRVS